MPFESRSERDCCCLELEKMDELFSYASSSSDYSSDDGDIADLDSTSPIRSKKTSDLSEVNASSSSRSALNDTSSSVPESSASSALASATRSPDHHESAAVSHESSPSKALGTARTMLESEPGRSGGSGSGSGQVVVSSFSLKEIIVTTPTLMPARAGRTSYTAYCVVFEFTETNQRCIWKRFSEFEALRKAIAKKQAIVRSYKGFPPKSRGPSLRPPTTSSSSSSLASLSSSASSLGSERCLKLDTFLKFLVTNLYPLPKELSEWIKESDPSPKSSSSSSSPKKSVHFAVDTQELSAATSNHQSSSKGKGQVQGGKNDEEDNDDGESDDDENDDDDDSNLIRASSEVARSVLVGTLSVATPSPSPSPTRAETAASNSHPPQPGSESSSLSSSSSFSSLKSNDAAAAVPPVALPPAAATATEGQQEPHQEPLPPTTTTTDVQAFPHLSPEKELQSHGSGNNDSKSNGCSNGSDCSSGGHGAAKSATIVSEPEKRRGSSFSSSSSITGFSLRAKAGSFLKIGGGSAAPSPSRKPRLSSSSGGGHTVNHNLDAGDPSDHSVAQYSEKDVARAVKEAQEAITARYSTALADAETKALQSASQLHEEALAAAKTRELELQRLLDTALANEQQALRARHEMEGSAAQLQHELAALAHRQAYVHAMSHLHVRIRSWERDAKSGCIRFLVQVKSLNSMNPIPPANYTNRASTSGADAAALTLPHHPGNLHRDTSISSNGSGRSSVSGGGNDAQYSTGSGNINTAVRRRFSEFVDLASSLHSSWPLPPKGVLGNKILGLTSAELASRATALESFLQHVADTVAVERSLALRTFLELPSWQTFSTQQQHQQNITTSMIASNAIPNAAKSNGRSGNNSNGHTAQPSDHPVSGNTANTASEPPLPLPHSTDDIALLSPRVLFPSSSSSSSYHPPILPLAVHTSTSPAHQLQHQSYPQHRQQQHLPSDEPVSTEGASHGDESALPTPSLLSGCGDGHDDDTAGGSNYDNDESDSRDTTVL